MKVLLTGSSGFIGSAIAVQLDQQVELIRCGRHRDSDVLVDLGTADALPTLAAIPRCDWIVHAAAHIDYGAYQLAVSQVNALGTHQLTALAARWGAGMVYLSSVPVIGAIQRTPITESHPVVPRTVYHASKWYGEQLLVMHGHVSGLPALSLRIPAPIGPGLPPGRIASEFIQAAAAGRPLQLAGCGGRRQSYLDIRDIALTVARALTAPASGVYLIGPDQSISNLELAQACGSALGREVVIEYTGRPDPEEHCDWQLDCSAAARDLAFAPAYTLVQSLRDMARAS